MSYTWDGANTLVSETIADISAPPFTYGAWVLANSAGESSTGRIVRTEQTGGTGAEFEVGAGPVLKSNVNYDTTNAAAVASTALTTGVWWAAFFTLGTDQIPHLFQGSLTAAVAECAYTSQTTGVSAAASGTNGLVVGNRSDQTGTFDGKIAYATVWRRVLTLNEMESFRRGRMPTNPYSYFGLTQYDTSQVADPFVGAAATVTLVGTRQEAGRSMLLPNRPQSVVSSLCTPFVAPDGGCCLTEEAS